MEATSSLSLLPTTPTVAAAAPPTRPTQRSSVAPQPQEGSRGSSLHSIENEYSPPPLPQVSLASDECEPIPESFADRRKMLEVGEYPREILDISSGGEDDVADSPPEPLSAVSSRHWYDGDELSAAWKVLTGNKVGKLVVTAFDETFNANFLLGPEGFGVTNTSTRGEAGRHFVSWVNTVVIDAMKTTLLTEDQQRTIQALGVQLLEMDEQHDNVSCGPRSLFYIFVAAIRKLRNLTRDNIPPTPDNWCELIRTITLLNRQVYSRVLPTILWDDFPLFTCSDEISKSSIARADEIVKIIFVGSMFMKMLHTFANRSPAPPVAASGAFELGESGQMRNTLRQAACVTAVRTAYAAVNSDRDLRQFHHSCENCHNDELSPEFFDAVQKQVMKSGDDLHEFAARVYAGLNGDEKNRRILVELIFEKGHPVFLAAFMLWKCPICSLVHTSGKKSHCVTMPSRKLHCATPNCCGQNPNRTVQLELKALHANTVASASAKASFVAPAAKDATDPRSARRIHRRASISSTPRRVTISSRLAEGFANPSKFKCAVAALLAWLYKTPAIEYIKKSNAFQEVQTLGQTLRLDEPALAATTAAMVNKVWGLFNLPDDSACVLDVFQILCQKVPAVSNACTYTLREAWSTAAIVCAAKATRLTVVQGCRTISVDEFDGAQIVGAKAFLDPTASLRTELCSGCRCSHDVTCHTSVDTSAPFCGLFAAHLQREIWLNKKMHYRGGQATSVKFVPEIALEFGKSKLFLQAVFAYKKTRSSSHHWVYIITGDDTCIKFDDDKCLRVAWPDGVDTTCLILAIYGAGRSECTLGTFSAHVNCPFH